MSRRPAHRPDAPWIDPKTPDGQQRANALSALIRGSRLQRADVDSGVCEVCEVVVPADLRTDGKRVGHGTCLTMGVPW